MPYAPDDAMPPLDAPAVARLLREFGQRTALRPGNPYRAKAYARAADNLATLTIPLDDVIRQGRLQEIPGVGEAIAGIIERLYRTGTHPSLEAMRKEIPDGVLEMLSVPGLRPEKVLKIYHELGIASLAELEEAARAGRLAKVKGLGPVLQTKILHGLDIRRSAHGARHIHRAAELLRSAGRHLEAADPQITRVTPAGELRRGCELVRDLALVAEVDALEGGPHCVRTDALSVYRTDARHFGIAVLFATGSEAHLDELRKLAAIKGMALEPDGLRHGRKVTARREEDIYAALGLPFVAPELREGRGEIERALAGELPEPVGDRDLRGLLHVHTERSDGADPLDAMAEATRARGYGYLGIADHSKSAHYAGGLSIDEIEAQHAEIDRLNARYGGRFRIFKGIESDILPDGSLDYPDDVLARFDFVVASVHSRFKLDRKSQTERMLRAIANPYTTILGHMTGRQLLRRPGYDVDIEALLAACARHGVAVEINANPWRLDLDWRWHQTALALGCMMSIDPDAHSTAELDLTHWGVEMARKGGVPKERVLNCLSAAEFAAHLRGRTARLAAGPARSRRPARQQRPAPRSARTPGDDRTRLSSPRKARARTAAAGATPGRRRKAAPGS
jgi:DNA polymerase (family X)